MDRLTSAGGCGNYVLASATVCFLRSQLWLLPLGFSVEHASANPGGGPGVACVSKPGRFTLPSSPLARALSPFFFHQDPWSGVLEASCPPETIFYWLTSPVESAVVSTGCVLSSPHPSPLTSLSVHTWTL